MCRQLELIYSYFFSTIDSVLHLASTKNPRLWQLKANRAAQSRALAQTSYTPGLFMRNISRPQPFSDWIFFRQRNSISIWELASCCCHICYSCPVQRGCFTPWRCRICRSCVVLPVQALMANRHKGQLTEQKQKQQQKLPSRFLRSSSWWTLPGCLSFWRCWSQNNTMLVVFTTLQGFCVALAFVLTSHPGSSKCIVCCWV